MARETKALLRIHATGLEAANRSLQGDLAKAIDERDAALIELGAARSANLREVDDLRALVKRTVAERDAEEREASDARREVRCLKDELAVERLKVQAYEQALRAAATVTGTVDASVRALLEAADAKARQAERDAEVPF